jgi:FkbM family methyltransferase
MNSKSQINQDIILDEQIFNKKTKGTFVEVGALDGFGASNTWFFEKERDWSGLLIEPNPIEFNKMDLHPRPLSFKENCAISNEEREVEFLSIGGPCNVLSGIIEFYPQEHKERINRELNQYKDYPVGHDLYSTHKKIKIKTFKLQTLLEKYNLLNIDLVSIDVEGAELQVLNSINFEKTNIYCFLIEKNYNSNEIVKFLGNKGYKPIKTIEWDMVFLKQ